MRATTPSYKRGRQNDSRRVREDNRKRERLGLLFLFARLFACLLVLLFAGVLVCWSCCLLVCLFCLPPNPLSIVFSASVSVLGQDTCHHDETIFTPTKDACKFTRGRGGRVGARSDGPCWRPVSLSPPSSFLLPPSSSSFPFFLACCPATAHGYLIP